jgi:flagellar biosynthesis protein FliQ
VFSAAPGKQMFGHPTPLYLPRLLPTLVSISVPIFFWMLQHLEKYNQEILFCNVSELLRGGGGGEYG